MDNKGLLYIIKDATLSTNIGSNLSQLCPKVNLLSQMETYQKYRITVIINHLY